MKKEFKKVLIISKMTEMEMDELKYGSAVDDYYRRKNIDVKAREENHKYHYDSLDKIVKAFQSHKIYPGIRERQNISKSDFKQKWDLVVPVGGDGTFMDAARYVTDGTPFFGIKSSPKSIGGHYSTNFSNSEEHIKNILSGKFVVEKRTRIEGTVNNEYTITDLALNDIFVGDLYNPGFSVFELQDNTGKYLIGSSGLVVSTYKGKTGWYDFINVKSNEADFLTQEEKILRYKIRDKNLKYSDQGPEIGRLLPGEEMKIVSKMVADGKVVFDGNKPTRPRHRVYDFEYGNEVTIRIAEKPLYVARMEKPYEFDFRIV